MRKCIFYFFICAHLTCAHTIFSCPYYFSPDDQRPFFEQYDIEHTSVSQTEKEEKS